MQNRGVMQTEWRMDNWKIENENYYVMNENEQSERFHQNVILF